MSIVQNMVTERIAELLADLEALAVDIGAENVRKEFNPTVSDLTNAGQLQPDHLQRLGVIQFQLVMLNAIAAV